MILCGGSGTRLWPLSRKESPKQFLPLTGDKNLFEKTYIRSQAICPQNKPLVVTLENHRHLVAEQMRKLNGVSDIICEPKGKNTCPAITAAAFEIFNKNPKGLMLILPSEHHIQNEEELKKAIISGLPLANSNKLVTFGIKPRSAHTGFGYIKAGKPFLDGFFVEEFTEKPRRNVAESYLSSGTHLWNSGMFLFRARSFLEAAETLSPEIFSNVKLAYENSHQNTNTKVLNREDYEACPSDSIDFAIMEKSNDVCVVPLKIEWNDIGSWEALWNMTEQDSQGNSSQGDVILSNSKNSFVRAESRLVAVTGVENTIVIETQDAVLVTAMGKSEEIKKVVSKLEEQGREESQQTKVVRRPWGTYESVAVGTNYQVKRIIVHPGQSLSLQKHKFRSEHWTVVVGKGVVNLDDTILELTADESVYIPAGSKHRLSTELLETLEIIEVQNGTYLGEDDIIRYEDTYGRVDNNT